MYYRQHWISWRSKRGLEPPLRKLSIYSMPHGCGHVRWAVRSWRLKARSARLAFEAWQQSRFVLRIHGDWPQDVREAQKAYPGTEAWLLSCSSSEGGWGRWFPNSQGSGAGGWMQFMSGTFYSFARSARTDLLERGFHVDEKEWDWYSQLGQALAGAWGITHGMRHHWSGARC